MSKASGEDEGKDCSQSGKERALAFSAGGFIIYRLIRRQPYVRVKPLGFTRMSAWRSGGRHNMRLIEKRSEIISRMTGLC